MFIIWGSKNQREHLGKMSMKCPNCQDFRSFNVYETSSKFTLYYLPLFTYGRKQVAFCNSCGYLSDIPKGMEDKIRERIKKTEQSPVDREKERKVLARILQSDPNNEVAWVSMAGFVDDASQKRQCYKRALTINPQNTQAKNGLVRLSTGENQPSFQPPIDTKNNEVKESGWAKILGILFLVLIYLASIYFSYQIGYTKGMDYTAQRDSTNSQLWRSEKWKYEIIFPADWDPFERAGSSGADVACRSSHGQFSTMVFVSKSIESRTLAKMEEEILQELTEYEDEDGKIRDISSNDYVKNGVTYRKLILRQADITYYTTLVIHNSYEYAVVSASLTEYFETARKDFDVIAASLNFFD